MSTYNGYKNYETWLVSSWIQNDQDTREWAFACVEGLTCKDADDSLHAFVFDQMLDDVDPSSLTADLMAGALETVYWREVVAVLKEE